MSIFSKKTVVNLSLSALAVVFLSACNGSHKSVDTTIVHVNDIHSHLSEETLDMKFNGVTTRATVGGYARLATFINDVKSKKDNVLVLNAGDVIQGTLFYTLYKGEADASLMNTIEWDALVLGNHEFDDGDENLANLLNAVDAPVVAANVEVASGNVLEGLWTPYIIKKVDGEKIGIFGIDVKQKTVESSRPSDEVTFLDEIATAQATVDELEEQGINKIIMLSHYGYENDKILAQSVSGVDVIIDGDSHTLLGDFSDVGLSTSGDYPTKLVSKNGEPVCIAQAWEYLKAIGELDVSFSKKGLVTSCSGTSVIGMSDTFLQKDASGSRVEVNASVKAEIMDVIASHSNIAILENDADVLSTLATFESDVNAKKNEVIGAAPDTLRHIRIPGMDYLGNNGADLPLGSEIAPIVAKSFYDLSLRSDACIQNAGGVRINVDAGNITMDTAYSLLPFSNTLFEIEMTGAEIKQVLEDALVNYIDNHGSTGSFPYAYGLKYDVDTTLAASSRISNLEIKDRETGSWSSIDMDKMYVVVTNDYIASGKDGYTTFATVQTTRGKGINTYLDYALSFVEYVEAKTSNNETVVTLPASDYCIKSFK